jgi:hypothetical protein
MNLLDHNYINNMSKHAAVSICVDYLAVEGVLVGDAYRFVRLHDIGLCAMRDSLLSDYQYTDHRCHKYHS